jgi:hypothetical protein
LVKLSQLASSAMLRTPRRRAVLSSGTSENTSPGLAAITNTGL